MPPVANSTATEFFDKTADDYDAITGGYSRELGQHVVDLIAGLKPLTPESRVLDNACGTGIVTDIILRSGLQPEIHAVDFADNMIRIARSRLSSYSDVHATVMPGEDLSFPDDFFTHSITNLGLMFFADADKGAREISRTLHPDGIAVVTGWALQSPFKILQEVQVAVRPHDEPSKLAANDIWLDPKHTKTVLSRAGLEVLISTTTHVHMGAETIVAVEDLLVSSFHSRIKALEAWSQEERDNATEVMRKTVRDRAVAFNRPEGRGFGIKLTASVFVARKRSDSVPAA